MGRKPRINVGSAPESGFAPTEEGGVPRERLWNFSFRFWRQVENFGFDGAELDTNWFVSLLDQLRNLSSETVDELRRGRDSRKVDVLRYHEINWQQPHIPLQRRDFDWLPKDLLENEVEFPFYQFQISTGNGRVVGFWDESDVFHILLLDPRHNLQPSKNFNYRVDPCSPMRNQFETNQQVLHSFLEETRLGCSLHPDCLARDRLRQLMEIPHGSAVICLGHEHWQDASNLIQAGTISCIDDLFMFALWMAEEHPEKLCELTGTYRLGDDLAQDPVTSSQLAIPND